MDADPTFRTRHDETRLRELLADAHVFIERLALCVAGGSDHWLVEFADQVNVGYRRRQIPFDDVIGLLEGIRAASRAVLAGPEIAVADEAIDGAIANLRWHRRLAGDARKKNRLLQAIYKGG